LSDAAQWYEIKPEWMDAISRSLKIMSDFLSHNFEIGVALSRMVFYMGSLKQSPLAIR